EDGIRDLIVTGVQTCALPIFARGEGTLAMAIEDGGVSETETKTIPILLQTLDLTLYPEGGELVAGLPSRLYLEARTPAKKPADQIGRASCRERVESAGARGAL